MLWLDNSRFKIGKIHKTLSLPRFIFSGFVKWQWRRNYFAGFYFNIFKRHNPHIAIVGESGSGKSNLCKLLLKIVKENNVPFILLDPHNEYVESAHELGAEVYDASFSGINIFDLDGFTARERASEISAMFKRIFRLGDVQHTTLYKCIEFAYKMAEGRGRSPSTRDLMYTIKIFLRNSKTQGEKKVLGALEKRLMLIDNGSFAKSTELAQILRQRSIFALSSLHTSEAQAVYIEGFLKKIYSNMLLLHKTGKVNLYVIVDEAEKLGESSVISRLVAEGRKYGIGVICISQRAKALDRELRSNASLFVSFSQHEPEESNYIANFISGGNELNRFIEVKKAIRSLGRGRAIVLNAGSSNPAIVKFDLFCERNKDPTHQMITIARNAISKAEMYRQLTSRGFAREAMNTSLSHLLHSGTLKSYTIAAGSYADTWYITYPKNSAEHDIMVNLLSRHLASFGTKNNVYNTSYGPDVIAHINRKRIAIEYETGLNDFSWARKMIEERCKRFDAVIVVTNDSCKEKYSQISAIPVYSASEFLSLDSLPRVHPKDSNDAPRDPSPANEVG
ncbi:MAG: ATP-binding protein [Candidatus Micrarchaeota archaeon]|nr:ATP-binding protein [Candidatus Micrarchaeota archaeon]